MIFKRNNVHFSAQETPGELFPQICSLKDLSSSVVSGKPNSDIYSVYIFPDHNLTVDSFTFFSCDILIPGKIDKIIPTPKHMTYTKNKLCFLK